ncbi:hypothetical protein BD324DRAFT_684329 [Kockovaella imperatae]|uniref:Uncharacterized protein n=1 Tax=Kockovaella imperatae TaxID=4999 RepID=A0A1Y1U5M0_9TREE|nr:hypothetical protein BD324DRAFT_684329 [Kockovaella imperatae]ORX33329.1 hypothetical protein BD324DRAFT_684329 [Kockovaella imperatae]
MENYAELIKARAENEVLWAAVTRLNNTREKDKDVPNQSVERSSPQERVPWGEEVRLHGRLSLNLFDGGTRSWSDSGEEDEDVTISGPHARMFATMGTIPRRILHNMQDAAESPIRDGESLEGEMDSDDSLPLLRAAISDDEGGVDDDNHTGSDIQFEDDETLNWIPQVESPAPESEDPLHSQNDEGRLSETRSLEDTSHGREDFDWNFTKDDLDFVASLLTDQDE